MCERCGASGVRAVAPGGGSCGGGDGGPREDEREPGRVPGGGWLTEREAGGPRIAERKRDTAAVSGVFCSIRTGDDSAAASKYLCNHRGRLS